MSDRASAALTTAAVAAIGVVLHLLGDGELARPPLADAGGLVDWYEARSPATAAIALVRFLAELSAWYVLGLTVVHGVARLLGAHGMGRITEALALPGTRRLVRAGLGLGLLAATAAATGTGTGTGTDEADRTTEPAAGGRATMRPSAPLSVDGPAADPVAGTARMVPRHPRPTSVPTEDQPRVVDQDSAAPTTWRVERGESLWSIAEEHLTDHLGRPATDGEIDPYWRALVERNRDRLVDGSDTDLIHRGQVFELPPLPEPLADDVAEATGTA